MKGLEHTGNAPYELLAETDDVIVLINRNNMVHELPKSDGYSFLRDQWRVWGKNIGAYMCDGRPFVVIAETDNFWILKDYNGKENYWMKCNCELRPFTPTPATHEFDGDTYDYQAVKERLSSLKPITTILLLLCLLITGCNTVSGIGRDLTYCSEKIGTSMNE